MKKIIAILILIVAYSARAQQIPMYNQYYINPFVYNPALTGTTGSTEIYLIHRNQWQDFPGAPITSAFTFDTPIQKDKIGVGLIVSSDQTGPITRTEAMASMSYRARISPQQSILFGLAGGILDNRIDFNSIIVGDPTEASLFGQNGRRTDPNATFGMTYQYNRLELGVAVPQLFAEKLPYINQIDSRTYYTLIRHYIGTFKYTFDVNRQHEITAYPLVLVRTAAANVPVETDVSGVINWAGKGWAALSFRSNLSVGMNLGIEYKGLRVGYVYEVPTSSIASYAGSSSEILLGYTFGKHSATEDKMDQIIKKLDKINHRLDTLENKVNRMKFDRVDNVKQELNVGDLFVLRNVNFEYNSAKLKENSFDVLDELIVLMNNNPTMKIAIYGHTDDIGSDDFNDKLSQQRAKAVYDYLLEGSGIKADRINYKGYGKRQPLLQGESSRARARNRRVEFKVISK